MKKIILASLIVLLSGCSTIQNIFMAEYDTSEYALVTKVRTISQSKSCDVVTVKELNTTALELKNFSQYLPRNEKTYKMNSDLYVVVEELYKKQQPISQFYCDLKMKTIETMSENIQSVTGKRPR